MLYELENLIDIITQKIIIILLPHPIQYRKYKSIQIKAGRVWTNWRLLAT
jgi:hypothetical protein